MLRSFPSAVVTSILAGCQESSPIAAAVRGAFQRQKFLGRIFRTDASLELAAEPDGVVEELRVGEDAALVQHVVQPVSADLERDVVGLVVPRLQAVYVLEGNVEASQVLERRVRLHEHPLPTLEQHDRPHVAPGEHCRRAHHQDTKRRAQRCEPIAVSVGGEPLAEYVEESAHPFALLLLLRLSVHGVSHGVTEIGHVGPDESLGDGENPNCHEQLEIVVAVYFRVLGDVSVHFERQSRRRLLLLRRQRAARASPGQKVAGLGSPGKAHR